MKGRCLRWGLVAGSVADGAMRRLYASIAFFFTGATVGAQWDRWYHWSRASETFFSAPHLFMYGMAALSAVAIATIVLSPSERKLFGPGHRLPFTKLDVAFPLLILGSGLACVLVAGLVDSQWHAAYGLDETSWATPHALLWWGLFQASIGFTSCRLALATHKPMALGEAEAFAFMVLVASITITVGPFAHNNTPATVAAIAAQPQISGVPASHHLYQVYLTWDLTRTNALFPVFSAFGAGLGLALLRAVTDRKATIFGVACLVSALTTANDYIVADHFGVAWESTNWLPIPVVPAACALFLAEHLKVSKHAGLAAAGMTFGLFWLSRWGAGVEGAVCAVAAGPALVVGSYAGDWIRAAVVAPTWPRTRTLIVLLAVLTPIMTGAVDLYLRSHTP